jgi:hypothetical protein
MRRKEVQNARIYTGGILATALFAIITYSPGYNGSYQLDPASALVHAMNGFFPLPLTPSWFAGYYMLFIIGGVAIPFVYSRLFYSLLTPLSWFNGVVFGVILWACRELVFVPLTGAEHLYIGFWNGTSIIIGSLIAHQVYAITLCVIAGRQSVYSAPPLLTNSYIASIGRSDSAS